MAVEIATFGSGCFWCSEAVYQTEESVLKVTSGYTGGNVPNPTYDQICTGNTGHAEVVRLEFDATKITYEKLVKLFFQSHDPTTLNRQGNDVGTQYRSVIYYHSPEQKQIAEQVKAELEASGKYSSPIVTDIEPAPEFYPAEDYHQDFYLRNKRHPYCANIITPKLEKLTEAPK
ncbi:peptide-methionine (S)-S-oxide reductase MsrA [Thalassoglobus polymorphus]|uniref:Peptide methionine sulfoxide reductase MsrA n=1 Tax=Thalassoglobus polymorphus TaxID=2527994 RepID=A0A517QR71_9PLAN|nr:peptide-methionine (S)-S-oxide reductase MsrA [Thalassoglobus polymorphus]QDT34126.1 Peptide methionine sulfoxide reductase MsrA [Thalassoglobus polymorphus]